MAVQWEMREINISETHPFLETAMQEDLFSYHYASSQQVPRLTPFLS